MRGLGVPCAHRMKARSMLLSPRSVLYIRISYGMPTAAFIADVQLFHQAPPIPFKSPLSKILLLSSLCLMRHHFGRLWLHSEGVGTERTTSSTPPSSPTLSMLCIVLSRKLERATPQTKIFCILRLLDVSFDKKKNTWILRGQRSVQVIPKFVEGSIWLLLISFAFGGLQNCTLH